jgi:hypothetical protein
MPDVRILGYWMKVAAALLGAVTCYMLGFDIQNGYEGPETWQTATIMFVLATVLGVQGSKWHTSASLLESDVAERQGTRRLPPGRKVVWLPPEVWQEFPDPLPGVPDVITNPATDMPSGDVPPDENLRRLWLVRAQLAVHLNKAEARARSKRPGAAGAAMATAGMLLLGLVAVTDDGAGEKSVMAALLAMFFLVWPFASSLLACTEGFSLVSRRKQALQLEETRLMELDALRPGGPIGGPAVQAGELPYEPPSLAAYRPAGADESR